VGIGSKRKKQGDERIIHPRIRAAAGTITPKNRTNISLLDISWDLFSWDEICSFMAYSVPSSIPIEIFNFDGNLFIVKG